MVINVLCTDWTAYLRAQLKGFVGGVRLRSRIFYLALFSQTLFSLEEDTLKRFNAKGICSSALKSGQ